MSVGISTACFYPAATEEALRCVAEAGAKVTEVFFNSPSELESDFLRRISSIASDSGIRIRSIHPFTSFAEAGYHGSSSEETRFLPHWRLLPFLQLSEVLLYIFHLFPVPASGVSDWFYMSRARIY